MFGVFTGSGRMRICTESSHHRAEKSWKDEHEAFGKGYDSIEGFGGSWLDRKLREAFTDAKDSCDRD